MRRQTLTIPDVQPNLNLDEKKEVESKEKVPLEFVKIKQRRKTNDIIELVEVKDEITPKQAEARRRKMIAESVDSPDNKPTRKSLFESKEGDEKPKATEEKPVEYQPLIKHTTNKPSIALKYSRTNPYPTE